MPQLATLCTSAPIASNDAAFTNAQADAVQLHMAACTALAQALHTLRTTDLSAADLARAIGRARRGLTSLKRLSACEGAAA